MPAQKYPEHLNSINRFGDIPTLIVVKMASQPTLWQKSPEDEDSSTTSDLEEIVGETETETDGITEASLSANQGRDATNYLV